MRGTMKKLLVLSLLVTAAACSGARSGDPLPEEEIPASTQFQAGTSKDGPLIERETEQIPDATVGDSPNVSEAETLQSAFRKHAAALSRKWEKLSSEERVSLVEKIAKDWKDNLGDADLATLREDLGKNTSPTLQRLLDFEREAAFTAENFYQSKGYESKGDAPSALAGMGKFNFKSLRDLQTMNVDKVGDLYQALLDVAISEDSHLALLKKNAADYRGILEKTARIYGVEEYFREVNRSAPEFQAMVSDFSGVRDGGDEQSLDQYILKEKFPFCAHGQGVDGCTTIRGACGFIHDTLEDLLQSVTFTYSNSEGKRQWSFFNFEKIVDGTETRGELGVYQTKHLRFVRQSDID